MHTATKTTTSSPVPVRLLRVRDVLGSSGIKASSELYARAKEGLFPTPVSIGARSVAWPSDEIAVWIEARRAGLADDEMRALVSKIHSDREAKAQALRAKLGLVAA